MGDGDDGQLGGEPETEDADTHDGPTDAGDGFGSRRSFGARGATRSPKIWILCCGLVVLVVGAAAFAVRDRAVSVGDMVARTNAFVADAATFEFSERTTIESRTGFDGGPGSTAVVRIDTYGAAERSGRWYQRRDDGAFRSDRVLYDGSFYRRSIGVNGNLESEQWVIEPDRDEPVRTASARAQATRTMNPDTWFEPHRVSRLLALFRQASVVDRLPGRVTLEVDLELEADDLPELTGYSPGELREMGAAVDDLAPQQASVSMVVSEAGQPESITFSVVSALESIERVVTFIQWNGPLRIDEPASDMIDQTPWLDEAALAQARQQVDALAPTAPPPGWQLSSIDGVIEEWGDDLVCASIELDYSSKSAGGPEPDSGEDDEAFRVGLSSRECADARAVGEPGEFEEGPFGSIPSRRSGEAVELLYGDTVVRIDTTVSFDQLTAAIASISSFDVDGTLAQVAPLMAAEWHD